MLAHFDRDHELFLECDAVSRPQGSLPAGYFEAIYRRIADPWRFASSDYEREKYAATLGGPAPGRLSPAASRSAARSAC